MAILNNSPVLSMSEIVVQLFNNELFADVLFTSENDQVIHAHSFLLMSRSRVYETEFLSNQGVQKVIPVQKYDYETFYQFLRFIYTDVCTITNQNVVALLELSVKYKIPKLENMVLAFIMDGNDCGLTFVEKIKIFEFCLLENYQLLHNWMQPFIGQLIPELINSDFLLQITPNTMKSILNMDYIGTVANPVSEVDLFKALVKWMDHYCIKNGIAFSERCAKFDDLLKLIRFPVAPDHFDRLFTDEEFMARFCTELGIKEMQNSNARQVFEDRYKIPTSTTCEKHETIEMGHNYQKIQVFEDDSISNQSDINYVPAGYKVWLDHSTKTITCQTFELADKLIITGLRIKSTNLLGIQLKETSKDMVLLNMEFKHKNSGFSFTLPQSEVIVSLGESYVMHPGTQYQIEINSRDATISNTTTAVVDTKFIRYYNELIRDHRLIQIFFKIPE